MKNLETINEITRIFEIMNNQEGILLIENMLLFEQEKDILKAIKRGFSKYFDIAGERAVERFLVQDGRPFEKRLESFLDGFLSKKSLTKVDKDIINDFFKTAIRSSDKFREGYISKKLEAWKRLEDRKGTDWLENIVRGTFGDEAWNSYVRAKGAKPKPVKPKPVNPKPVNPKPSNIPTELKDEDGVKEFQKWLNDNQPGWNPGSPDGNVSEKSRSYGKFGKNTSAAWNIHRDRYLESLKVPEDLKKPGYIGHFQDWLDSNKPGWTTKTKEGRANRQTANGYGQWNQETKDAWLRYGEQWRKSLDIGTEIGKVDVTSVETQDISLIERFFASQYTATGEIRPFLYNVVQPVIIKFVEKIANVFGKSMEGRTRDEIIDTIIGNFKLALEKSGQALQKGQAYADVTLLRKIMMDIRLLQSNIDVNVIVDEIVSLMKQNESKLTMKERAALDDVIKVMKANDPMTTGSKSWFMTFLKGTSWATALSGIFDKQITWKQKFKNLLERTFFFGLAGTPKKWSEIKAYWEKYGTGPGLWKLTRDVWVAAKIGFPVFLALVQTLINGVRNLTTGGGEKFDGSQWGFVEFLERNYIAMMTGSDGEIGVWSSIYGTVWPLHFYAKGWYDLIVHYDKAIQRKDVLPLMKQLDELFRRKSTEVEKTIENNEYGFAAWALKEHIPLLSGTTHPEIWWVKADNSKDGRPFGRTQDGKNYVYDLTKLQYVLCTDCAMKQIQDYDPNVIDKVDSLKQKAELEYDKKIGPTQAGFLIWASKNPSEVGDFNPVKDIVNFNDSTKNPGAYQPTTIELTNDRYFMWNSQTGQWEKY